MPDFYDDLTLLYDAEDHREIAASFVHALTERIDLATLDGPVVDLGCGSGAVTEFLARAGVHVIGIDLSGPMLDLARRNCRRHASRVAFLQDDLRAFTLDEPAALACACGDIMNHMPTARDLERVFSATSRALEPGAPLIFETLNAFCFEHYWNETYFTEHEQGDLVMACSWDPDKRVGVASLTGFIKDGRGAYRKVQSEHVEYLHDRSTIRRALSRAGFRSITREDWSPWPDQHLEPAMDRDLWIARKR